MRRCATREAGRPLDIATATASTPCAVVAAAAGLHNRPSALPGPTTTKDRCAFASEEGQSRRTPALLQTWRQQSTQQPDVTLGHTLFLSSLFSLLWLPSVASSGSFWALYSAILFCKFCRNVYLLSGSVDFFYPPSFSKISRLSHVGLLSTI